MSSTEYFWHISGWGAGYRGADARWWLEVDLATLNEEIYMRGQTVAGPPKVQAVADRDHDLEDCAWAVCRPLVVSQRFRELLELEAPRDCQFVPVEVSHAGRLLPDTYWLVNCLRLINCIDDQSPRTHRLNGTAINIGIDADRVPPDVQMFRVIGKELSLYIRDSLKNRIKKAKLTGCQFHEP